MPKIKMNGGLMNEIYVDAINSLPYGGAAIANVLASNPRNQPCPPKKAFDKTCQFMRHILKPEDQANALYAATRNLLVNKYGYPPAVLDCYRLQVQSNSLVLRSNRKLKSLLKNLPNMVRDFAANDGQTVSDISKIKASKEEVTARLSQHQQWLKEREDLLKKARELFGASEEKQREFAASIPDHRANLSGLEIRDMDLSAYDLSGVICKGSRLENCVLGSIAGMDLSGSQIFNSKLIGSNMSHARFNDTQLDQVTMQNYKTMAHADFTGSRQHSVQYFNCNFEDAILSEQMAKNLQAQKKAQQASEQQAAPTAQQRQAEVHSQRHNDIRPALETEEPAAGMVMSM